MAVATREVFDVAAAAQVELVRDTVRIVAVMREHRVGVDVRGVAVHLDVLVAEHVHRGVEDRDATDVGDHRVAVGEPASPTLDLEVGREACTHHLHVAAVDAGRVAHDDVVDLVAIDEQPQRVGRAHARHTCATHLISIMRSGEPSAATPISVLATSKDSP